MSATVRRRMPSEDDLRRRLGEIIQATRLSEDLDVPAAADRAPVSKNTWAKAEKGLGVREVQLNKIGRSLGFPEGSFARFLAGGPEPVREVEVVEVGDDEVRGYAGALGRVTPSDLETLERILAKLRGQMPPSE